MSTNKEKEFDTLDKTLFDSFNDIKQIVLYLIQLNKTINDELLICLETIQNLKNEIKCLEDTLTKKDQEIIILKTSAFN